MNANFLATIKRIVAEQGESILAEPRRLKGLISDYAKDEPRAERLAVGRCIEYGAYTELKNAPPWGRAAVKNRLAQKLYGEEGLDPALCAGAMDLLEAALLGAPDPSTAGDEWVTVAEQKAVGQPGSQPAYTAPEPVPVSSPPQAPAGNMPSQKHIKRNVLTAAAIIVVVAAGVWFFVGRAADLNFKKGLVLYEQKDYEGAIVSFTKAIKLDPKNARAYATCGDSYLMKGDYDRAIADSTDAIKLAPEYAFAYATRGASYSRKGDYDRAIADCTKAISIDPKYTDGYYWRGRAYIYKEDYDRAIADFNETIRIDPKHADGYYWRGFVYIIYKQDYDQAIADYTKTIRIDPKYALAYKNRSIVYSWKGDYDHAIADYNEAIRIDPGLADGTN
jgi:tetratricopeptide (TPR) repeat protein